MLCVLPALFVVFLVLLMFECSDATSSPRLSATCLLLPTTRGKNARFKCSAHKRKAYAGDDMESNKQARTEERPNIDAPTWSE